MYVIDRCVVYLRGEDDIKMSWRNSRDTTIANIVQQSTSILIFLAVPNLLSVEGYGQVVFVGTLLSFMTFADLGMSFVYGRKMPAIYASGDVQEVRVWNETIFTFRLYTGLLFGIVIGVVYFFKYQAILNAALLISIPPLTVVTSFYVEQNTALLDFSTYRKVNSFQAIVRLVTIPGTMFLGLLGWFLSQVVASLMTLISLPRKLWYPNELKLNTALLREYLFEGVLLGATATLWAQLLASGRVFASFLYPDVVIAEYGLMNAGYQIVGALIIAAFIPQTVKVYKKIEVSLEEAIEYTFETISYAIPVVFALAIISREAAPFVAGYFFPQYRIDGIILTALIFSLPVYPLVVTLGSLLIGRKKTIPYFLLLVFAVLLNGLFVNLAEPYYGYRAAAIAQLATLWAYSALLLALVFYIFRGFIEKKTNKLLKIYGSILGLYASYFLVKYVLF